MEAQFYLPYDRADLARWARSLRADFSGRAQGGQYMVLLTWRDPLGTTPLWALGWSDHDEADARRIAERRMIEERHRLEFADILGAL